MNTNIMGVIHAYNHNENSPEYFAQSYVRLRRSVRPAPRCAALLTLLVCLSWVDGALDLYRRELSSVLWPVFVHVFLQLMRKGFPHDANK